MTDGQTKMCMGCGRQIPVEYNVCPYCGRPQNQQQPYGPPPPQSYQQPQQFEPVGGLKYVLYILSFISLFIGFIIFLVWMSDPNPEKRQIGKNCLIISVVGIILSILCVVMVFVFSDPSLSPLMIKTWF